MKQNFERVGDFYYGFSKVKLSDDTYNFIDKQGNLLSKQNFEWVYDFYHGFVIGTISSSEEALNILLKNCSQYKKSFECFSQFKLSEKLRNLLFYV